MWPFLCFFTLWSSDLFTISKQIWEEDSATATWVISLWAESQWREVGVGGPGTSLMCMGCRTLHSVLLGDLFQKLEPVPTWWVEHGIREQWEHKNFAVACSQFCPQEARGERRKFAPARHSWLWTHNMHTSNIYRDVSSPWGLSHTHPQLLLKLLSHFSCPPPPLDT